MLISESLSFIPGRPVLRTEFIFTSHSQLTLLCSCPTAVEFPPTSSSFSEAGKLVYIWNGVPVTSGPHRISQNIEVITWMNLFWCNAIAENYLMDFFLSLVIYLIKTQWNREESFYLTFKEGEGRESDLNVGTERWPQDSRVYWPSVAPRVWSGDVSWASQLCIHSGWGAADVIE